MLTRPVSMLAIFGLLPASFVIGEIVTLQQLEMQQEGIKLIHQVRDVAREVHYHAEQLNYVTGATQISKRTQHQHLDQIKSQVNEGVRPALKRLTEIRPQLPGTWSSSTRCSRLLKPSPPTRIRLFATRIATGW